MLDLAAIGSAPERFSGLACPRCHYRYTHRAANRLRERDTCPDCDAPGGHGQLALLPQHSVAAMLDNAVAQRTLWHHATREPGWLSRVRQRQRPVHLGTALAAAQRARDVQQSVVSVEDEQWWFYRLVLAKNTAFHPGLLLDEVTRWPGSLVTFEALAVDAIRYLNGHEDPGGVSLLVDPNFVRIHDVTQVRGGDVAQRVENLIAARE